MIDQPRDRYVTQHAHQLTASREPRERDLHQAIARVQVAERERALVQITCLDRGISPAVAREGNRALRAWQGGHDQAPSDAMQRSSAPFSIAVMRARKRPNSRTGGVPSGTRKEKSVSRVLAKRKQAIAPSLRSAATSAAGSGRTLR